MSSPGIDQRESGLIYLHFLDRELLQSVGSPIGSFRPLKLVRRLSLLTSAAMYCGLSAIWENDRLDPGALAEFELLVATADLQLVSRDLSLHEYLASRQIAYAHDSARYPRYFGEEASRLEWAVPTLTRETGSTAGLDAHLNAWSGVGTATMTSSLRVHEVNRRVGAALKQRESQAITYGYFSQFVADMDGAPFVEMRIRRAISEGFTEGYLASFDGDIATGIPGLQAFDRLGRSFPSIDMVILGTLGAIVGMNELCDPDFTPLDRWAPFIEARRLPEAARFSRAINWITTSLGHWARHRPLRTGETVDLRSDLDHLRRDIQGALRDATKIGQHLAGPLLGEPPAEYLHRAYRQAMWVGNQLKSVDSTIGVWLDMGRNEVDDRVCDVLLVTVNDTETEALTTALEARVGPGRVYFGEVNTYWDYGPVGGVRVAHLRTAMGSGGQSGSGQSIADALREREPKSVVAVGVAFGMRRDRQPIGQVLISEKVAAYELQRINEGSLLEQATYQYRGPKNEASARLLSRFRDTALGSIGLDVVYGEMLSGEKLVDNAAYKGQLAHAFPDAIGGEMEGAGVQAACGRLGIDWIVVKSVCDYGEDKSDNKVARQATAAETAARAVVHVLVIGGLAARR